MTINNDETTKELEVCDSQDRSFYMVYTIAVVLYGAMAPLMGAVYDKYGLRVSKVVMLLINTPCLLMMGLATPSTSWMIYPAAFGISIVAMMLLMINNTVCALAGDREATVSAHFLGATLGSITVYWAVKLAHDAGFSRLYSFIILTGAWVIVLPVNTLFFSPKYKAVNPSMKGMEMSTTVISEKEESDCAKNNSENNEEVGAESNNPAKHQVTNRDRTKRHEIEGRDQIDDPQLAAENESSQPYVVCGCALPLVFRSLCSLRFIFFSVWYGLLHMRIQIFVAGANMWFTDVFEGDKDKVSLFTDMLVLINLGSVLLSVVAGILMDRRIKQLKKKLTDNSYTVRTAAAVPTVAVSSGVSIALSVVVLVPGHVMVYFSLAGLMLNRVFVYGMSVLFYIVAFPEADYGRVYGTANIVMSATSFGVQGFLTWAQEDDFQTMNYFLLGVSVVSCWFPVFLEVAYRRKVKK